MYNNICIYIHSESIFIISTARQLFRMLIIIINKYYKNMYMIIAIRL